MNRFTTPERISVASPYRLDLTTEVLRRTANNAVDLVAEDGSWSRAFAGDSGACVVRVVQTAPDALEVCTTSSGDVRMLAREVKIMLGVDVDLAEWYERVAGVPWLARLAAACEGVRPPRYPTLWEACAHAIVFQQISIHAAASIMRRVVERFGTPLGAVTTFPSSASLAAARSDEMRACGLSENKALHLRAVAQAIECGDITEGDIESLPTGAAAKRLIALPGIGPWSAAVVLLRGFGRLDTFPMGDSGVAAGVKLLSNDPAVDLSALLDRLGPVRGMLYYHLLLGRIRNLLPGEGD